jgi:hypothetical protein
VRGIPGGAYPECRSNRSALQGAFATARHVTPPLMGDADEVLWRVERLQAAIDQLDGGNINAFGRRMGLKDGSYIGQMLRGSRPITEKFVHKLESIHQMDGWFDRDQQVSQIGDLEQRIRTELLRRDVPEHILKTILDLVTNCPVRRKVA